MSQCQLNRPLCLFFVAFNWAKEVIIWAWNFWIFFFNGTDISFYRFVCNTYIVSFFRSFSCYHIRTALLKSKEKHCVVSRRCWYIFNLMAARLRMLTFCAVFIGVAPFFRDGACWVNVILCHKTTISNKSILQRFYNLQQFILIFKKMVFPFAKYLPLPFLNSRLREINITGNNTRVL